MVASFVATQRVVDGRAKRCPRRPRPRGDDRCCTSTTGFFRGETGELQRRCTDERAEDKQPCGGHILRLAV